MAKQKALSQQHRRFIAAYRRLRNATRAYMEVYPRASHATADTCGPTLMRDPRISSEIASLDSVALKGSQASADQVLAELSNLGFSDIGNLLWKPGDVTAAGEAVGEAMIGTLKPLHMMTPEVRRTIKSISWDILGRPQITLWSGKDALNRMAQHHKLLTDKIELGVDASFGDLLEEARRKLEGGK